jgi:hypothetical protein
MGCVVASKRVHERKKRSTVIHRQSRVGKQIICVRGCGRKDWR